MLFYFVSIFRMENGLTEVHLVSLPSEVQSLEMERQHPLVVDILVQTKGVTN